MVAEKLYETIGELVAYGRAPLMVVLGPSGSGKTTFIKRFVEYIPPNVPWFLFYNSVRASEYSELKPGTVIISGDCLLSNCYETLKLIETPQKGFAAVAEPIACELLRMKGLAAAEQCEDVGLNSSIIDWGRIELRPMLSWIDAKCVVESGAIPYKSHVDLLRLALLRCCIGRRFIGIVDDAHLAPRINYDTFMKSLRDTASVVVSIHPDKSLEREVTAMITSAYVLCLTPRENWSKVQIDYVKHLTEKELKRKIEPAWGGYRCLVLQKEYELPLPPPKKKEGEKRGLLKLFK